MSHRRWGVLGAVAVSAVLLAGCGADHVAGATSSDATTSDAPAQSGAVAVTAERCRQAIDALDGAAIGTLHAFAQRLLREHPVEAGLPPVVEVMDEGAGFDPEIVRRVVRLVDVAEWKRRQAPIGVRVTPKAFGKDRRMPITNGYRG